MRLFSNKKDLDDAELLKRYRRWGDAESLGLLYERYLHLVYGLCLKYLKSREASQDATMDIYEILAVKLKKQDVEFFKSWLYMVSKNHCLMILRKSNPETKLDEKFMESDVLMHPMGEDNLESDLMALEDCIDRLRDDQKLCVQLFYLERKSYQEIAGKRKMELKKVKSFIQNGKRNLKICLEGKDVRG
ncbi:MAG: sigma-70 family RNA polymerase sigma factor [Cyclobacteriaceae bacterium]